MSSVKKRRKSVRYPGSKTHGRGRKNRTRGSGNRGGVGLSGTGKRGDQKKTLMLNLYGNDYFGKATRGAGTRAKKKVASMSLRSLVTGIQGLVARGMAHETKNGFEVKLPKHKIIGDDVPTIKLVIHAKGASEGAKEAVEKAGGQIILETESETDSS